MAAVLAASTQAQAQKPIDITAVSIEDLARLEVYSASKFLQPTSDAPSSISVVTADEIARHGFRTLADILRSTTGFYISDDRNYSYAGVRGFGRPGDYNTRVLVLLDGHRMNDVVYDGGYVGAEFPLDLGAVERVEIVRGPGSSLYGTNAFFAVVNVITRRGRDLQGARFSAQAGSRGMYQGTVSGGARLRNGLEVFLAGSYFDSDGYRRLYFPEFDSPESNFGMARDLDGERGRSLLANVSYRDVSTQVLVTSRDRQIPTAPFGAMFGAAGTRTTDERAYVDVKVERLVAKQWQVLGRAYVDHYRYGGTYAYEYEAADGAPYVAPYFDSGIGSWWGGEAQISRRLGRRHRVTFGSEIRQSFRQDQRDWDESQVYLDARNTAWNAGWFVQDEISLRKNLILNAGVRYDHFSTFGGTANPRVGLIWSPRERTTVKVLYGTAFRAPNSYELYYVGGGLKANPSLRPEGVRTAEIVVERYLGKRFRVSGSAYRYHARNLISQSVDESDGLLLFRNAERIGAQGVELELETKGFRGVEGRLGYVAQEAVERAMSRRLSNSPAQMAYFRVAAPVMRGRTWVGLDGRYVGPRVNGRGSSIGGYLVTNVTLFNQRLARNWEFDASVYNVFDRRYLDPGGGGASPGRHPPGRPHAAAPPDLVPDARRAHGGGALSRPPETAGT